LIKSTDLQARRAADSSEVTPDNGKVHSPNSGKDPDMFLAVDTIHSLHRSGVVLLRIVVPAAGRVQRLL
jgi:hypothetical protein